MAKINHLDFLNLLCKNKSIIDEAYKRKKINFTPPSELVEIGFFQKVGKYYYINSTYINLIDTILKRAEIGDIAEDFDKELKRLSEYKKEYKEKKSAYLAEIIDKLLVKIYQGMQNRDSRLLSLIEKLEKEDNELDFLIKEANRIVSDIKEINEKNSLIYKEFQEFMEFEEFREFVSVALNGMTIFIENSILYLNRLSDFIIQTKRKREFNKKLSKIADMILNEDIRIDDYLTTKTFPFRQRISPFEDIEKINVKKAKKIVGNFKRKKEMKEIYIKNIDNEIIYIPDIKNIIQKIEGSEDIFETIINLIPKNDINESVRIFMHIINHYDEKIEYKDKFNSYNIRVVKWKN
jgi:hypothetical protein